MHSAIFIRRIGPAVAVAGSAVGGLADAFAGSVIAEPALDEGEFDALYLPFWFLLGFTISGLAPAQSTFRMEEDRNRVARGGRGAEVLIERDLLVVCSGTAADDGGELATLLQVREGHSVIGGHVHQEHPKPGVLEDAWMVPLRRNGERKSSGRWRCSCRGRRAARTRASGCVFTLDRRGSIAPWPAHHTRWVARLPRCPTFALRLVAHILEYGPKLRRCAGGCFLESAYAAQKGAKMPYASSVILKLLRTAQKVPTSAYALYREDAIGRQKSYSVGSCGNDQSEGIT